VWSARVPLKLANRACETRPRPRRAAARPPSRGLRDERPALRPGWALLQNQAHDSLGGCSVDRARADAARYDGAASLRADLAARARVPDGLAPRVTPLGDALELAVWNPSPFARAGVVRLPLDPWPFTQPGERGPEIHPWLRDAAETPGFRADGAPARVVAGDPEGRFLIVPGAAARDLELVVGEVPALGWRRVRLERAPAAPDQVDDGREIACGETRVRVAPDGTLALELAGRSFAGLAGLEDEGDRGDSYDADPIPGPPPALLAVRCERRRHASGIAELRVVRELELPARLAPDRERRSEDTARVRVETIARLAPGERGVRLRVRVENEADDHRLRLLFPSGAPCAEVLAATTFGMRAAAA
jgi:alpha-mannosidase/mannosylglycerate hydrolase